jgi:hypothetical protein
MRSNRHHLASAKRGLPRLLACRYGGFLILATLGNLAADPPPVPADSPVTDHSPAPDSSPAPGPLPAPANPPDQGPDTPLLPIQGGNPNSPYSSTSTNPQSAQITAPSLFLTGANDLSGIGTNDALSQAFNQQAAAGFSSDEGPSYTQPPIQRLRLGPIDLESALTANVVADDNLRTGTTGEGSKSDTIFSVTPALLLVYGNHDGQRGYVSLIYAPTILRYLRDTAEDAENQNVALNVQYPFQRLTLDLTQTYAQTTGVNEDSNVRTTQSSSLTTFGGRYEIDDRFSVAAHAQEVITSFSGDGGVNGGEGDQISSLNTSLTYRLSDKITLGPNFNVGLEKPQDLAHQTYEQGSLGMTYKPTEKIDFFAQSGVELRQYDGGGQKTNPIFSAGAGYQPFDSTSLTLRGSQSVHSSSAAVNPTGAGSTNFGQTVVSTGVGVSATQRFAQRFYLNFSFTYNHNDGENGGGGGSAAGGVGSEDTFTYQPSIRFAPTAWTSAAIYYQYLANESNQLGSAYHDNQVGISLSVQF